MYYNSVMIPLRWDSYLNWSNYIETYDINYVEFNGKKNNNL